MAGYIRPSEHSPRRKLHPQLSRCSIDIALIMIGSCNFKAEEDTVHHHRVLRCKRDIARYWKPLVYHWQYWKLHHMGQVSTGSYECYGVIGGYIHSLQFLPLKRRQRGPFQGNHDWKPIPGPAELRPFVGTGRSGERISRTSNWSSLDSRKILNYNSHIIRIDNAPTERPYHAWHKAEMVFLRPESPS